MFTVVSISFSNITRIWQFPVSFFPIVSVFQRNKIRYLAYLGVSSSLKSHESACLLLSRKCEITTIHSMMSIFSLMSYLCPAVLLLCLCIHNYIWVSMLRHSWTFWKTFSMVIKLDMCSSNNAHDSIEVITIWITEMKVIHGSNDNSVITANSLTVIARLLQLWQLWDGSHH